MMPTRIAVTVAALAACVGTAALAEAPVLSSPWVLSSATGAQQCRLALRADQDGNGARVGMPSGCHRAFPSLARVAFWSEAGDSLRLEDARHEALLVFDTDGEGYRTTSPQGQRFNLKAGDAGGRAGLDMAAAYLPGSAAEPRLARPAAAVAPVAMAAATTKPAGVAATKPAEATQKPADVAGRYAVLRDKTHDTGCMVTLDDKAAGPGATLKARLAPACRDQGIMIFDPIGWRMAAGKMILTARKGHTTELASQPDGSWMNDPKAGKTLSLKRL